MYERYPWEIPPTKEDASPTFEAAVAAAENEIRAEPFRAFEGMLDEDELAKIEPILRAVAEARVGGTE